MAREPSDILNKVIKQYYRFRDTETIDLAGNTPFHYACESGDNKRICIFVETIIGESYGSSKHFKVKNKKDQTPADVAQSKKNFEIAAMLYQREFAYSRFYEYLTKHFGKKRQSVSSLEVVKKYQDAILTEMMRLSHVIQIPTSELDDTIISILEKIGIKPEENLDGFELPIFESTSYNTSAEQATALYNLTPIGKFEEMLRSQATERLSRFVKSKDGLIQQMEERHDKEYDAAWQEYHEIMQDFEDGDDGYDYEGPVRPCPPNIKPFNARRARREIDEDFS